MEGNRDTEGWKLKKIDDSSLISAQSLTSLDATREGVHGLDLVTDATYSPVGNEDEDKAVLKYWLNNKMDNGSIYAPTPN